MWNEIKEELQTIATSVAGIGNANCYCAPDNYFEDLADEVLSKIQLPAIQSPLAAPAPGYFEGLADAILNKIKSNGTIVETKDAVDEELVELSPMLASINKANVFTAPADYFTNFKVTIPAAGKETKVLTIRRPTHWMRYAAAAAVAGIIATGGFFMYKNNGGTGISPIAKITPATLSSVSDDAIINYLKNSPADMDIIPSGYDDNKVNAGSLTEELLQDVSDTDIKEYLKENQQPGEKDTKGI